LAKSYFGEIPLWRNTASAKSSFSEIPLRQNPTSAKSQFGVIPFQRNSASAKSRFSKILFQRNPVSAKSQSLERWIANITEPTYKELQQTNHHVFANSYCRFSFLGQY
jgi:hypothetical protein